MGCSEAATTGKEAAARRPICSWTCCSGDPGGHPAPGPAQAGGWTSRRLFAAVDVYIIIGLIFATLFIGIALEVVRHGPPFLAQPPPHAAEASDYVYLSYVTSPRWASATSPPYTDLARSVVVLEALIGQIFLVTLVAQAGGALQRRDRRRSLAEGRVAGPERGPRRRAGGLGRPDAREPAGPARPRRRRPGPGTVPGPAE